MDSVPRLSLRWCVLLLVVLWLYAGWLDESHAYGEVPKGSGGGQCTYYRIGPSTEGDSGLNATQSAACHNYAASASKTVSCGTGCSHQYVWSCTGVSNDTAIFAYTDNFNHPNGQTYPTNSTLYRTINASQGACAATCPANSADDEGKCVCNKGFRDSPTNECEPYTCPGGGTIDNLGVDAFQIKPGGSGQMCFEGCVASGGRRFTASDGNQWLQGPFRFQAGASPGGGRQCEDFKAQTPQAVDTPASGPNSNTSGPARDGNSGAPSPCGKNTCPGTVNGTATCQPCSESVVQGSSGAASVPAGTNPFQGAPEGSRSFTEETTCANGSCTTVRTYRDAGGAVTGTVTSAARDGSTGTPGGSSGTGSGNGSGEGEESAFGGACAATTCTGDAVTCAIAKEQHKRDCEFALNFGTGVATTSSDLGIAAAGAGMTPGDHPRNAANVQSSALTFDQTNIVGGSCPADLNVSMPGGHNVSLPFSSICTPATWLGNILVGLTALTCLGIVFLRGA